MRPRIGLFSPYGYLSVCTSVLNAAVVWESLGYGADIYFPESDWEPPTFPSGADIRLRSVRVRGGRLSRFVYALWAAGAARDTLYEHVIGYDQGGLGAARLVAARCGCDFSYHSLELWLRIEALGLAGRVDKALETMCARHAQVVIAQDSERGALLARDLRLGGGSLRFVPNTPLGSYEDGPSDYLRGKFGIAEGARIVLQSGSLIREHLCVEIVQGVPIWPDGFELVVHGWAPDPAYREAILDAARVCPERVHVCFDVLPVGQVDSLYASADIGLALYATHNANFEMIGNAAGKVFRFMRVGVPVVAQNLPGLAEFVSDSGCGLVLGSAAELPAALARVAKGLNEMDACCRRAFEEFEFGKRYLPVVAEVAGRETAAIASGAGRGARRE